MRKKRVRRTKQFLELQRQRNRERNYGLSDADFQLKLSNQENRCGICNMEFVSIPRVDHDHNTGQVRGLLCSRCNSGLGMFLDDETHLLLAIRYLRKYRLELRTSTEVDRPRPRPGSEASWSAL